MEQKIGQRNEKRELMEQREPSRLLEWSSRKQEWDICNDHLKSIIRDNKGVWLSNKGFWWAIGIFEVAVCLAIYFGGNALIAAVR